MADDSRAGVVSVDTGRPTGAPSPAHEDIVQVVMTERMARVFEERCLGANTVGPTSLSPPMFFGDDHTPTYIIQVDG